MPEYDIRPYYDIPQDLLSKYLAISFKVFFFYFSIKLNLKVFLINGKWREIALLICPIDVTLSLF